MIRLLDLLDSAGEEQVQQYLTARQDLLLATFAKSHYSVSCIPKFRFGLEFVSDFVIVMGGSYFYEIVLIELEPPTVRPFTKAGLYAKRLNGAIGQVNSWLSWIRKNNEYFRMSLSKRLDDNYARNQLRQRSFRTLVFPDPASLGREKGTVHFPLGVPKKRVAKSYMALMINAKIVIGRRSMLSDRDNETRSTIYEQSRGALELLPYDRLVDIEAATSSSQ